MSFEAAIHAQAIESGRLSLEMTAAAGSGHPTSSLSIGHLVTVLMFHTMRWSPDYPDYPTSDRLVLSEGHAVPAVYAAAAQLGVMYGEGENRRKLTTADLKNLRAADSELDGHPNPMEGFPFFDAATGSLGQGLSVGAGLSAAAKIPFCSTFSKFFTRAYDQIEMAINSGANLKLVGSHSGVTLAADGPSQMSLPDVAWFRAWTTMKDHRGNPGCYVLQPADAYAAYALTGVMAEYEGVCYMRTLRAETEFIYSDDQVFNLGGFEVLHEGRDVVLCASGYMVHEANKAIDALDAAGVSATLVDLYSLPFDREKLLDIVAENNGYVISIEDNYGGSMGSAIADALVESGDGFTLEQMFVRRIPKSARTPEELLAMCGLTSEDIVKRAMGVLQVV